MMCYFHFVIGHDTSQLSKSSKFGIRKKDVENRNKV